GRAAARPWRRRGRSRRPYRRACRQGRLHRRRGSTIGRTGSYALADPAGPWQGEPGAMPTAVLKDPAHAAVAVLEEPPRHHPDNDLVLRTADGIVYREVTPQELAGEAARVSLDQLHAP